MCEAWREGRDAEVSATQQRSTEEDCLATLRNWDSLVGKCECLKFDCRLLPADYQPLPDPSFCKLGNPPCDFPLWSCQHEKIGWIQTSLGNQAPFFWWWLVLDDDIKSLIEKWSGGLLTNPIQNMVVGNWNVFFILNLFEERWPFQRLSVSTGYDVWVGGACATSHEHSQWVQGGSFGLRIDIFWSKSVPRKNRWAMKDNRGCWGYIRRLYWYYPVMWRLLFNHYKNSY